MPVGPKIPTVEQILEKSEEKIAKELESGRLKKGRVRRADAEETAELLREFISGLDGVEDAAVAGSFRRWRDTVGDLDIIASSENPQPVIDAFVEHDLAIQVTGHGDTRAAIVTRSGLAVDLRVVKPESYGAALLYFTGSKDHGIVLRKRAIERDWTLNEYFLSKEVDGTPVAGRTEQDVYKALDLPYILPELRENRGEFEASENGALPDLVDLSDIRGDVHTHTTWSDGKNSIEEMAQAALDRGYEYVAITDHSPRLAMTGGLGPDRLREQAKEIANVQDQFDDITILHGNEVDILKDGSLDQPDDILAELEIVIASVHSHFDLSREEQTERVLKAIANPYVRIIGHPLGRLVTQREGIDIDLEAVFKAARDAGVALEINADPHRLDLDDRSARFAKDLGAKFTIDTDAHRARSFGLMRHGIGQARRAWIGMNDVLNTLPLEELHKALRPKP